MLTPSIFMAITAAAALILPTGNTTPRRSNSRSAFTFATKLTGEGQHTLANNLQFLCTLKPSHSVGDRSSEGDNIWVQALQDSILAKIVKPGESLEDYNMKRVLTENIVTATVSNCEEEFEFQDQPSSQKGVRQTADTNYVENILQNIFSGNIMGIIRSYSPTEKVSTAVSDVFRTLLTNISSVRTRFSGNTTTEGTTTAKPYAF